MISRFLLIFASLTCLFILEGCSQRQLVNFALSGNPYSTKDRCSGINHPIHAAIMGCTTKTAYEVITPQNANDYSQGICMLQLAWNYNKTDFFEELITQGADPLRCQANFSYNLYRSATLYACHGQRGRGVDSTTEARFAYFERLGIVMENKQKIFREVISSGCAEGVPALAKRGVDINYMDENGLHPIDYAVNSASDERIVTVSLLIKLGANPNLPSSSGETTMQRAERFLSNAGNWPRMKAALNTVSQ